VPDRDALPTVAAFAAIYLVWGSTFLAIRYAVETIPPYSMMSLRCLGGGAILIGLVAGGLCYSATLLRERLRIDDALDVFAVHGVGGVFGAVATGVLATSAVQGSFKGLIDGNPGQVLTQLLAVAATIAYAVIATFVIVKVVDLILGIRISVRDEELGMDLAVHGEVAYQS